MAAATKHESMLNRRDAELKGLARYEGRLCLKHPEEDGRRYKSSTQCVGCGRDRDRKFYHKNKERIKRKRAGVV